MSTHIKTFADQSYLEFAQGQFDAWCVFMCTSTRRYAPRDTDYFQQLKNLAAVHGAERIYEDFVKVFDYTKAQLNLKLLDGIGRLASHYGDDALEMDKLLTILYAGMVAEENKAHAVLKKRIKRLGLHQVLLEDMPPAIAANYSKGKPWRNLAKECEARGF